jgi:hypothetical protein
LGDARCSNRSCCSRRALAGAPQEMLVLVQEI